ncbi:MAG: CPBP family intramembrane metalloprotease [Saprospiraceae bacterium]|nr:CPBP family intramembrane metalloprotease [Saprospiraceae bacterium]
MKQYPKAIFFLVLLTILDFLLRKGIVAFLIPFELPPGFMFAFLFAVFSLLAWLITKGFCQFDNLKMQDLGITFNTKNSFDFSAGFSLGILLWGIVALLQAVMAGFSWTLRPDFIIADLIFGLIFIFIADLGTELFTRGYPLTKFEKSFGARTAIIIMVFFVGFKSFSFNLGGELLLYTMLIPALHTIFFSMIYLKTRRLGGALGVHTGANLVTISIFDLRPEEQAESIPAGIFQPSAELDSLSLSMLQLPYIIMAILFSVAVFYWWKGRSIKRIKSEK